MPLINGLQFIEGFKEKFQDSASKILIISSHLDDDLIEKYKSYGVVEILIKPVDIKKLTESLNKLAF
jgi:response regulator of citrate/malate metabolism